MLRRLLVAVAITALIGSMAAPPAHAATHTINWLVPYGSGDSVQTDVFSLNVEVGDTIVFRAVGIALPSLALAWIAVDGSTNTFNPLPPDGPCQTHPLIVVPDPASGNPYIATFTLSSPGVYNFWAVATCGGSSSEVHRRDREINHTNWGAIRITVNPPAGVDELPTAMVAPAIALAVFGAVFVVRRRAVL